MLTVHHLGISQSDRIVWLCEELGIPYELRRYERDPVTMMAPPAYRALYPYGTAPVITDDDVVLGESGAIAEYIIVKHGGGRMAVKPDSPDYPHYLYWLHFANASMMPNASVNYMPLREGAEKEGLVQALLARNDRAYAAIEKRLGEARYFGGNELTAADILMLFPLTTMRSFAPRDLTPYPNLRAYLQRIGARPAFQRAAEKADPGVKPLLN